MGTSVCTKAAEALPGLHAFTGCDYTASFLNKGKQRPMELMLNSEEFKAAFAELGMNDSLSEETLSTCEIFVCHMYGKKN